MPTITSALYINGGAIALANFDTFTVSDLRGWMGNKQLNPVSGFYDLKYEASRGNYEEEIAFSTGISLYKKAVWSGSNVTLTAYFKIGANVEGLFTSNSGVPATDISLDSGQISSREYEYYTYGVEDTTLYGVHIYKFNNQNPLVTWNGQNHPYLTIANLGVSSGYSWECWPQLAGNANTFLMNLSLIDNSIIGDGSTPYETFDGSYFTLENISRLYNLVVNLLNGQETVIAYCGDNYLTATRRTTYVNDITTIYCTLKFYFRSDVLIYTTPELIIWSNATGISEDYLCIIYDEENEVAAPDIIQVWTNTGKIGINEYTLPSDEQMRALYIWLQDNGQYREHVSPYDTGTTDTGGDPGTPTPQDHITDSPLPTLSGLGAGIVTLYRPTAAQLASIAAFLWSDNVLDNFKKYFNNFADNLLNLYILPFTPSGLTSKTFKVGNMTSEITGVEYCDIRYFDIDMGSIDVKKLWDSYLDFAPYTKIEIYLPYLGLHSLDIDEIMCPAKMDGTLQRGLGSVLKLKYRLDILTGVIVAKVFINGEVRYQFEGKVGANIPLTGATYASMAQGIIQAGAGLATTIASGGLTAPLTAAAAVTGTVNASKPNVERIGNITGDASMMATNVPYIVVSRPNKPLLDRQENFTGFPSYMSGTLGSFDGFTQVIEAHVEGISCTEEERTLILKWLKEGVIL